MASAGARPHRLPWRCLVSAVSAGVGRHLPVVGFEILVRVVIDEPAELARVPLDDDLRVDPLAIETPRILSDEPRHPVGEPAAVADRRSQEKGEARHGVATARGLRSFPSLELARELEGAALVGVEPEEPVGLRQRKLVNALVVEAASIALEHFGAAGARDLEGLVGAPESRTWIASAQRNESRHAPRFSLLILGEDAGRDLGHGFSDPPALRPRSADRLPRRPPLPNTAGPYISAAPSFSMGLPSR